MTFGWGIAGTGRIARSVGSVIAAHAAMGVEAIGSRDEARAASLAEELTARRSYGSYDELVLDPDVDAVYVATPHAQHAPVVEAALAAGKAVLCEKPLTASLAETERLVTLAQGGGVFLMEAMWMRFNPLVQQLAELARSGALGELRSLSASIGFAAPYDPANRLWDPALGGGAMLDLGVYVVDLARLLLGEPDAMRTTGSLAPTGVDEQATVAMSFLSGASALLDLSLRARLPGTATLVGTRGFAELGPTFHAPTRLVVEVHGGPAQEHTVPERTIGFVREVEEVRRCVRAGLPESPVLPLAETVATMRRLDEAASQLHA